MFFNDAEDLWRILIVGILAYLGLILFQRISGKRTLSKMNAFDLIVTVALGSTLATVLLSREVSLSERLLEFAVLMLLQFSITWSSIRIRPFKKLIKSEPGLLLYQGRYIEDALNSERVLKEEVRQAIRAIGKASVDDVAAFQSCSKKQTYRFPLYQSQPGDRGSYWNEMNKMRMETLKR